MRKLKYLLVTVLSALVLITLIPFQKVNADTTYNHYLEMISEEISGYKIATKQISTKAYFTFFYYGLNDDFTTQDGNNLSHHYSDQTRTETLTVKVKNNEIDYTKDHNYFVINNHRFELGFKETTIEWKRVTTGEYTTGYTRYPSQMITITVNHEGVVKEVYRNEIYMDAYKRVTKTNESGKVSAYFDFDASLSTNRFIADTNYTLNFSEKQFFSLNKLRTEGKISFRSATEGFLNHLILIESENISLATKPGTYTATFKVDYQGEIYQHAMTINLVDNIPPVITGPDTIRAGLVKSLTDDYIIGLYRAFDNELDKEVAISIATNKYRGKERQLGTYDVELRASDGYNVSSKTIQITVVDDEAPVITGPSKIIISRGTYFNINRLKEMYKANDFIDGDIDIENAFVKTDDFTGNGEKVGLYKVVLAVSDRAGNIGSREILIEVSNDISNMFIVIDGLKTTFKISNGHKATADDFINGVFAVEPRYKRMDDLSYQMFNLDTYQASYSKLQEFNATIDISSTTGVNEQFRFAVEVVEASWFSNKKYSTTASALTSIGVVALLGVGVIVLVKVLKKKKRR